MKIEITNTRLILNLGDIGKVECLQLDLYLYCIISKKNSHYEITNTEKYKNMEKLLC